jgi:hypothetical protein
MRKIILCGALVAFAVAANAQAPVNRNANGFGYFLLQVPNPGAMVIDGHDNDWAWFDPTYVVTMDQWRSEQDAPLPDPSDFELTMKMGWSPQPENMWYMFLQAHDDTLDIESTDVANPWSDDCMNFGFDATDVGSAGGREYYQPYVVKHTAFLTEKEIMIPSRWTGDPVAWRDFARAPYAEAVVVTNPPEAVQSPIWTSETGGDMYYEFRMGVWDWRSPEGPSTSTRTILTAGKFLPLLVNVEDGDGGWRYDMTIRSAEATAAGYFAGTTLLGLSDYNAPTAVESSTWARVKAGFTN